MDIAIFGSGIAGVMAAVSLVADGHRCRIYESDPNTLDAGMGFILMPSAKRCRTPCMPSSWGDSMGVELDHYVHRAADGQIEFQAAMPRGARCVLRREVLAALKKQLPDEIFQFGSALETLTFNEHGKVKEVRLSNGRPVKADLYLGADGINSKARQAIYPVWPRSHARTWEIVGTTQSRDVLQWSGSNFNKFHDDAGGLALGILPAEQDLAVWYLQYDTERFAPPRRTSDNDGLRSFMHDRVGSWGHPIQELLKTVDWTQTHHWRPLDIALVPSFHKGNLVLLGDAAHPLLPFSSQGVATAMEDAATLAELLRSGSDLTAALEQYSTQRRAACLPHLLKGREIARQFVSKRKRDTEMCIPVAGSAMPEETIAST